MILLKKSNVCQITYTDIINHSLDDVNIFFIYS